MGFNISKETINNYLESKRQELKIPGLSIAIINNGKVVYQKTKGLSNIERALPVTNKTIFEGASLSKSLFAFFAMKYVEDGKLNLDKPLYKYLPYPDIAYDERYKEITARMVLSHRTGFPNWRRNEEDGKLKIKFDPGTAYEYSGEGYQYLAMVLRKLEGGDWHDLEAAFQEKVAKPIGMEHTVYIQTPYTREHKAVPYNKMSEKIDPTEDNKFGAAYSIHTEPMDFSKWMIAVMEQEQLLAKSYSELFKPHSQVPSGVFNLAYSLGFFMPDIPFTSIYLHAGVNSGFTCWYALDIEKNWGFVVFTNSEFGGELSNALFSYLLLGLTDTELFCVVGISFLTLIIGIFYAIMFIRRKLRRKKSIEVTMNKKLWFYIFLLWQVGGLVVTAAFSLSVGGFHRFTHDLIMVLTFTNVIGLGIAAVISFHRFILKEQIQTPILQYCISIILLGVVIYFGSNFALNLGANICGADSYEVGQVHLATIIINFATLTMATVFAILLLLYKQISKNLENKIHENTELSRLQLETKFALLQSKVNPHFLFNTLNSMLDVLKYDPEKVETMIMNLADIYHKTLTLPDKSMVSLEEELELVKEYLEIEKIRMGDRLEYRFQIKEHLRQTKIPPMIIQILVENAIRHGLAPKKEGGVIDISINETGRGKIEVSVNDTGVGMVQKESYSGYGLTCIKQQLKLLYATKATMEISLAPTGGTLVSIELPYEA